ncbi:MAG: HAMP domain-containing histidine kinase [Lachnospiraceae bacterium]|nr:HAMP domain-containing histidine kinase [Lachnospiraceae bacterium]
MKNKGENFKSRRKSSFVIMFFVTLAVMGILTTIQFYVIGDYIDYQSLKTQNVILINGFWVLVAALFTWGTSYQLKMHDERPMKIFAEAARKVSDGDFSVYLKPVHRADRMDYVDAMFLDFNKMVEELGSIETLKTDFVSNVSHEMKTPVAVMKNYAEMLQKDDISEEERKEYAGIIEASAVKLSDLIGNVLKLSKLENQRITPEMEIFDVSRQLCESILQFEDIWEAKEIEMEVEIQDSAMVKGDESLLKLVWDNLLSNALKFTEPGGRISVCQPHTDKYVSISVSDTGCGMSRESMKHIFDKFYQGDTSHSREGNGLGLALVWRVLQLLDGDIQVCSEEGKGSTFIVTLPAAEESDNFSETEKNNE